MVITGLDVILVVIVLISALLAMTRGFSRELFTIVSWGAAGAAALFAYVRLREPFHAEFSFEPEIIGTALLVGGVFIITLIIVSLITMRISDSLMESRAGALDRTLGFIYGALRGLLLVVVAYFLYSSVVPLQNQPEWMANARARPLLDNVGDKVIALIPEDIEILVRDALNRPDDTDEGAVSDAPADSPS
jgi:membrane protein required for colicin V production